MRFTQTTDDRGRITIRCAHCPAEYTTTSPRSLRQFKMEHRDEHLAQVAQHRQQAKS